MNQIDPPVFSKTAKIIIVAIFVLLFLASFVATMYLIDLGYPNGFQIYNLVPIIFIVCTIGSAGISYKRRHADYPIYSGMYHTPSRKEKDYTYNTKFLRKHYIKILIFLAQIPFQIPLIVYIEDIQALWSLLIYVVPLPIHIVIELISENLPSERKERKKRLEKEDQYERDILQQRFRDRY